MSDAMKLLMQYFLCLCQTPEWKQQFLQYAQVIPRQINTFISKTSVSYMFHTPNLTCTCNGQYPLVVNNMPAVGLCTLLLIPEITELYVQHNRNQNMTICILHGMFVRTVHFLYGLPALVWSQYTIVNHTKCRQSHVCITQTQICQSSMLITPNLTHRTVQSSRTTYRMQGNCWCSTSVSLLDTRI